MGKFKNDDCREKEIEKINDLLFLQLERLNDDNLSKEMLEDEFKRTKYILKYANKKIIEYKKCIIL